MFKSKITNAFGVICLASPRISDNPVSITHKRSHSSARIRNVETIVELSFNGIIELSAGFVLARPSIGSSTGKVFASNDGYGIRAGD